MGEYCATVMVEEMLYRVFRNLDRLFLDQIFKSHSLRFCQPQTKVIIFVKSDRCGSSLNWKAIVWRAIKCAIILLRRERWTVGGHTSGPSAKRIRLDTKSARSLASVVPLTWSALDTEKKSALQESRIEHTHANELRRFWRCLRLRFRGWDEGRNRWCGGFSFLSFIPKVSC